MVKRIGIFGGSFDPIHLGHINLAKEFVDGNHLDEVWFCPTYLNPFKAHGSSASIDDRLKMVEIAISGFPQFKITDIEAKKKAPCYTIDTIKEIKAAVKNNPEFAFWLMLGEDAAASFPQWKNAEQIVREVPLLIGSRKGFGEIKDTIESNEIAQAVKKGMVSTKLVEVSSTEIRKRLASRKDCADLLPPKVMDYILAHQLYL